MKKRWGKGDPVNLSDLLKITPVANEIMQLSKELEMTPGDIMWIVNQIIDNVQEIDALNEAEDIQLEDIEDFMEGYWDDDLDDDLDEEDDEEMEAAEDRAPRTAYTINVKVSSDGRFPEIGFKAGVNDKEDIGYFFDMVMEMLDKLD
ncbi:hypothetical protein SAMN02745221_02006 [Thermosyntropha lipolytica DSM 11003]|uniref:Uncharacterized protein n=1 Tax=Thermosyntropha lipolytica DSM 11003 TaxID=1123382 RepID=A0A1M5RD96_9FIRM|nr:hypothetical protein [Thermosyntropha lipolytica]SHH24322.1 hypothetical protein SAMN02745221_02006 [Thermosyntropha lipolytica DSM 11003]